MHVVQFSRPAAASAYASSVTADPGSRFSFDGEPRARLVRCQHCAEEHDGTTGYVLRDNMAYAIYFLDWYPHENEAWLDVLLGHFLADDVDDADRVTFGCRIGAIDGQDEPGCSLVPGAEIRADLPLFGTKLSRDEALRHPRQPDFWAVTDWLILNDSLLHENIYHD
jgi:hypothetical protein